MKVDCQSGGPNVKDLEFKARHGVFNIDGGSSKTIKGIGRDLEDSYRQYRLNNIGLNDLSLTTTSYHS